ncbi:MAG TPA: S8 family serine peptidase, partial [Solirubrobacterales bacterium]
ATFVNNTGAPIPLGVQVTRDQGTGTPFFKWIEQDNLVGGVTPQFDTASDTINPDAASAQGSFAVAAVNALDPGSNTPESFSSRGPKTRLFDTGGNRLSSPLVLQKPLGAAADGVSTSVPGFDPFFGTSASTPSAAGIAAILLGANPNASVNEIYSSMSTDGNSIDCTATAGIPDADCGYGFVLADRALAALDRNGPVITPRTVPRRPNGHHGWFRKPVRVSFSVSDPDSPIESVNGCGSATDRKQGRRTFTCSATSGGGPATRRFKVKLDSKPPSKPIVKGIRKGQTLKPSQLPAKPRCRSRDRTSGIDTCRVKGFSTSRGSHTLKAIATDKAGNRSVSRIPYRVL